MRRVITSLAVCVALMLAACGGDSDPATGSGPTSTAVAPTTESPDDGPITDLAANPDQFDQLVAAAEEEGRVVWYTSLESAAADGIAALFQETYDIEVIVQRSGGEDTLQRFLLEADSGQVQNDALTIGDPAAIISLSDEGYFECFIPRHFDDLHDWARDDDACWTASRGPALVMGYRTDLIAELGVDPPTSWADMTRPEFQGRVGAPNPNFSSSVKAAVAVLSEQMGWEWFEGLRDNGLVVVGGNGPLMDQLEAGELILGGPGTQPRLAEAKAAGLPIEIVYPDEGTMLSASPTVIPAEAPRPNAGKLLLDFLLTDPAQELLVARGDYVGRMGFDTPEGLTPLEDVTILEIDYAWVIDNADDAADRFTELFDAATD